MLDYKNIIIKHYALSLSGSEIARQLGASKSGVNDFLRAFDKCESLSYPLPPGIPVLVRLLYCTGLRVMEALHLQLKNVNLDEEILFIENAKFNKDRLIPVSESMLNILKDYCKVMHPLYIPEDFLFVGITREPCSHHNIYLRFRELLVQAGIPHAGRGYGLRIHDIRHTHCCHVLQEASRNGTDLSDML